MNNTGERYIPEAFDDAENISQMHLERYKFAYNYVRGKNVLDIACGEGYGSDLLSNIASNVIGVDIDNEAVGNAKNKYKKENLKFLVGGVDKIPLEDGSVDVLVSFETIEHVNFKKQLSFLKEVDRVLKKDSLFIVSTPDKLGSRN